MNRVVGSWNQLISYQLQTQLRAQTRAHDIPLERSLARNFLDFRLAFLLYKLVGIEKEELG